MNVSWHPPLWLKLTLAGLLVGACILGAMVYSQLRLIEDELIQKTRQRIDSNLPLLNAALAPPLMQRDYAALHEVFDQALPNYRYLVLLDMEGRRLAASGLSSDQALPTPDQAYDANDPIYDAAVPIQLGGLRYGILHFGIDMGFLHEARSRVVRQGILAALGAVLLTYITLAFLGYWLTRRLHALAEASRRLAAGDFRTPLPAPGADEVGRLAHAFAHMAAQLESRLAALSQSQNHAQQARDEAEAEHARLQALLSAMNLGILYVGADDRVQYHNPAFNRLINLDDDACLVGLSSLEAFELGDDLLQGAKAIRDHLTETLVSRTGGEPYEIKLKDGRLFQQLAYAVSNKDGGFLGHLWIFEDITGERQTAERLLYLAERDSLTGLYNRHRFQEELKRMVAEAERSRSSAALLFLDLDEFKAINDHYGHKAGDAVLIRVAQEVSGETRRNEMLFRLGGDEFALLMPGAGQAEAEALADRVVRAIARAPLKFADQILHISSSLGIALYPHHAEQEEQLVVCADAAMYQAKQAGKNAWRLYRADLDKTPEMLQRLSWQDRLKEALEQGYFELHMQGVYQARDRRLVHVEALLRLRDPVTGELVSPGLFIPIAEKSQLILDIDRWVVGQVVALLQARPQAVPIAVNISGRSFDDPSLPGYIVDQVRAAGIAPERLILEITETAAVSDLTDAQRFIDTLKQAGCRVCLDDFGTGFASFAYLKHIRVDTIKLDGMFIRNLPHDHDNQVFVRGMVEVARGLGKHTLAECVEDADTLALLATMGVDEVQGYFLDRPQPHHPGVA